ncbi:MAG: signal peptidase II [bacterium]
MKSKYLAIPLIAVIIDQFIKSIVRAYFYTHRISDFTVIPNFLSLVDSYNPGGAFGILQNTPTLFLALSTIFSLAALILLVSVFKTTTPVLWGLGLVAGGAIGNLVDRARYGSVYDFIDCYIGTYHWPAFNAADAFIVIGTGLLLFSIMRGKKTSTAETTENAEGN